MASLLRLILRLFQAKAPGPELLDLGDDLLREILLRIGFPADVIRASAACVTFRRLISSPSFLRRYRSIQPPLLLGFLQKGAFHPVEATHPSAAVARAVARTADFSFDFLPTPRGWSPCDVRDGRVLVQRRDVHDMGAGHRLRLSWNLAVCDPLSRRYRLLPPMTDDLLASVGLHNGHMFNSGASLIPSGSMEETSFSVISWMSSKTTFVVFVFSTSSGHWAVSTSISSADLGFYEGFGELGSGHCVYGCFYWKVRYRNKLLKLDMNTMELSTYDLPTDFHGRSIIIVESGEGRVAMFSKPGGEGTSLEYYTLLQNGTEKSRKWHFKSTIPLPDHGTIAYLIIGQAEGSVFLTRFIKGPRYFELLSLEVKSLNIERVCRSSLPFHDPLYFAYFGFPPSMSPRRIEECGED